MINFYFTVQRAAIQSGPGMSHPAMQAVAGSYCAPTLSLEKNTGLEKSHVIIKEPTASHVEEQW